jgi:nucleoside-diphosphate-sugar epimerase
MTTALITGGLGLIGAKIARILLDEGKVDRVVLLDHYGRYITSTRDDFVDYRALRLKGIESSAVIERGEAKHFGVISALVRRYKPDYIFHLAALPLAKLQNLNSEEALEGSVISTSYLLESIGQTKMEGGYSPKRFVYASSSMVYGDFQYVPADEKHPTNPKEIYGTAKLAGEEIARGLSRFFGIDCSIIRPSAVYGPTDMNRRVSQIFLEKAMLGQKITVDGADEALDFTYVDDIARGFVLAATEPAAVGETFNITFGRAVTLLEYVLELKKYFPNLEYQVGKRDDFRPKRGTLAVDKARKLLGYEPQYDLQRGIKEYVDFVREHHPLFPKSI